LTEYSKVAGDCSVPKSYKLPDGYKLGIWVSNQRTRRSIMEADNQARLESLPGWSWELRSSKWEEGFHHLSEYSKVAGHCSVPQSYKLPDGYKLGIWVNTQRNQSKQSPDRKARLESLQGWTWDPLGEAWETGFRHLSAYMHEKFNCLVPALYVSPDGFRLGGWVNTQRTRQSRLSMARRLRLESLPGWVWKVKG